MIDSTPMLAYIAKFQLFTEGEIHQIINIFHEEVLQPNDYFIRAGEPVTQIGFIVDGVIKATGFDEKGEPMVHYFVSENHFFSEAKGMYEGEIAEDSIQAATDCRLLVTTFAEIETLKEHIPNLELIVRRIGDMELLKIFKAQKVPKIKSATTRYYKFNEVYPTLTNRILEKDKAAFLGMDASTLCREKKKSLRRS